MLFLLVSPSEPDLLLSALLRVFACVVLVIYFIVFLDLEFILLNLFLYT